MAGTSSARRFTEADKAQGLALLAANDGNIKRTANALSISPVTLRRWRDQAKRGNGPSQAVMASAVTDFVTDATRIRDKALMALEQRIDAGKASAADLNRIMGTLDDKIRLAQGLPTARTESTTPIAADRETLREVMSAAVEGAIRAARTREEVIDAEVVREIPATTTPTKLSAVG